MEYDRGDVLTEGRGGFLGLLNGLACVGHEPWCSMGPCRGPVAAISDVQPLVQGRLAAGHGQALACTHFTPRLYVKHWGIVRVTGPAFAAGPMFLGVPCIRRHRRRSTIVCVKKYYSRKQFPFSSQKESNNGDNDNYQKIYASMARISGNGKNFSIYFGGSLQLTNFILDSGATCHMKLQVSDFIPVSL